MNSGALVAAVRLERIWGPVHLVVAAVAAVVVVT